MQRLAMIGLVISIFLLTGCSEGEDPYQYESVQESAALGNFRGWELQEILGDREGPFRFSGGAQLNAEAGDTSATYAMDGVAHQYDLSHFSGEVLLGMFQSKAGNDMVLVFTRKDQGDRSPGGSPDP